MGQSIANFELATPLNTGFVDGYWYKVRVPYGGIDYDYVEATLNSGLSGTANCNRPTCALASVQQKKNSVLCRFVWNQGAVPSSTAPSLTPVGPVVVAISVKCFALAQSSWSCGRSDFLVNVHHMSGTRLGGNEFDTLAERIVACFVDARQVSAASL